MYIDDFNNYGYTRGYNITDENDLSDWISFNNMELTHNLKGERNFPPHSKKKQKLLILFHY